MSQVTQPSKFFELGFRAHLFPSLLQLEEYSVEIYRKYGNTEYEWFKVIENDAYPQLRTLYKKRTNFVPNVLRVDPAVFDVVRTQFWAFDNARLTPGSDFHLKSDFIKAIIPYLPAKMNLQSWIAFVIIDDIAHRSGVPSSALIIRKVPDQQRWGYHYEGYSHDPTISQQLIHLQGPLRTLGPFLFHVAQCVEEYMLETLAEAWLPCMHTAQTRIANFIPIRFHELCYRQVREALGDDWFEIDYPGWHGVIMRPWNQFQL